MRLPLLLVCVLPLSSEYRITDGSSPLSLLFIMDDQHNPRMLGDDSNGYGGVQASLTPNLDQIAGDGVRFSHAYCASPQCVPSRYSLLTGRYPRDHGIRWNSVWEPARGELTLPALARRHGYVTATIGKDHLAWLEQPPPLTTDHGFDLVLDIDDYTDFCQSNGVPSWKATGNCRRMDGVEIDAGYTYNTNAFHPSGFYADQAVSFLEERGGPNGDGKPFVLWLSFNGPHIPILPSGPDDPDDWAHRYHPFQQLDLPPNIDKVADTKRLEGLQAKYADMTPDEHREALSYYYGLVSQIDYNVGRVLQRLEELELDDRTVLVFTSDHGDYGTEMACWTKGGGNYDCVTRVPLLIRSPGRVGGGGVSEVVTSGVDLFPTLVELLGLSPTPAERARVSGRSLADVVLEDETPLDWPTEVFSEFGPAKGARLRMAVTAADKYSHDDMGGGQEEYFDLVLDPWEEQNEIANPLFLPRVEILRSRLAEWWGGVETHAPPYRSTGDSAAPPVAAADPDPGHGAKNVATDVDPGWLPATSAASQEVFLGTDPIRLEAFAVLPPMGDHFNPGTLAPATTYYWRVDGANANGVTAGPVWRFATANKSRQGPGLAHSPDPAAGSTDVPRDVVLGWTVGEGAMAYDVWFGPGEGPLERVVRGMPTARYRPEDLLGGRSYRWRVDGIHQTGRTSGTEWTFTVDGTGLPEQAAVPFPAHLATDVVLSSGEALRWDAGPGALTHDVYFGQELPLPYHGRQDGTDFVPGALESDVTYYWRIDEVNDAGVTTGFTWRFRTKE